MGGSHLGPKFYIGLTNTRWRWEDLLEHDIVYANWDYRNLKSDNGECVYLSKDTGFRWGNTDCQEKKYYVCAIAKASATDFPDSVEPVTTAPPGIVPAEPSSAA